MIISQWQEFNDNVSTIPRAETYQISALLIADTGRGISLTKPHTNYEIIYTYASIYHGQLLFRTHVSLFDVGISDFHAFVACQSCAIHNNPSIIVGTIWTKYLVCVGVEFPTFVAHLSLVQLIFASQLINKPFNQN